MAAKEIIVDSSVWVSYFYAKDSQHGQAVALLEPETSLIIVPEYVLLETVTILRQKKEERALEDFLNIATNENIYLPAGNLGIEVASCYTDKKYQKLSFVDVSLAILAKKYQVITFDKALLRVISKQNSK